MKYPVHAPIIGEKEIANVVDALAMGEISGTFGRYIGEFEQRFAEYCECKYGVAVSSGSTALHLATVLANVGPGDEVAVSASTNIACANAVVQQGAQVIPIDSYVDTWCMNPHQLEAHLTVKTKAVMPVHLYGHPVAMDEVMALAKEFDLFVIEDCAEAHGAEYRGQRVGSFGNVGCFSFYVNKVITTGEGGMIVTNDLALATRARLLRNLAFTQPRFMHWALGYNYRMTNLQAAVGCAQLDRIESTISKKREIAAWYNAALKHVPHLRLPVERGDARNVYWMYAIVLESSCPRTRADVVTALASRGVETRSMFCPMNQQPYLLQSHMVKRIPCPIADFLWERGLYLPSGCSLTLEDVQQIAAALIEVLGES